jgi:hypothetical protein
MYEDFSPLAAPLSAQVTSAFRTSVCQRFGLALRLCVFLAVVSFPPFPLPISAGYPKEFTALIKNVEVSFHHGDKTSQ